LDLGVEQAEEAYRIAGVAQARGDREGDVAAERVAGEQDGGGRGVRRDLRDDVADEGVEVEAGVVQQGCPGRVGDLDGLDRRLAGDPDLDEVGVVAARSRE